MTPDTGAAPLADEPAPGALVAASRGTARQSALVVANSVVGAAMGYVGLFAIVRYMGTDGTAVYGERAYALALVSVIGIVARLGLPMTHVRQLAKGGDVGQANGAFAALKGGLTAVYMLVALGGAYLWFGLLHRPVSDTTPVALWLAYWIVVVQSVRDIPVTSFQGLRLIREREAVLFTNTFVTIAGTLVVGIAYADSHGRWSPVPWVGDWASAALGVTSPMTPQQGLDAVMWAFFAGEVLALLLALALFMRRRIPVARPPPGLMAAYLRFTVPLMLLAVGEALTKSLAQVMVGFWWDPQELGQYAAAAKITELLMLVAPGIAIVLLPTVADLHGRKQAALADRATRAAERWVSLLLWPAVVVLVVDARSVIHVLLADESLPAAGPMAVLAFQALVASLAIPVQVLAVGSGRPRLAARIVGASVLASAILGVLLIPRSLGALAMPGWGALGAAIAALGGTSLALALYAVPHRSWPGHLLSGRLFRHVLAAAAGAAVALLLPAPARFTSLVGVAALATAAYGAALVLLGELRGRDWRDLRDLIWRRGGIP